MILNRCGAMKIFNFFRSKRAAALDLDEPFEAYAARTMAEFAATDHLGKAAVARDEAKAALTEKKFDEAWRKYHEEKQHFMNHAARCNFTAAQTIALDGSVSKALANVLRLEKRHGEAFVHVVYWVASSQIETKEQTQKLRAYFNRCKFDRREMKHVRALIEQLQPLPDLRAVQEAIAGWESSA